MMMILLYSGLVNHKITPMHDSCHFSSIPAAISTPTSSTLPLLSSILKTNCPILPSEKLQITYPVNNNHALTHTHMHACACAHTHTHTHTHTHIATHTLTLTHTCTHTHMWSWVLPIMVVTSHVPEVKKVTPDPSNCAMCVKLSSPTSADISVKREEPSNEERGGSI